MVADTLRQRWEPTGTVRIIKRMFRIEVQEEFAVFVERMGPYAEKNNTPSYYAWRKMRFNQVLWIGRIQK